jgi:hypothetical protein
VTRDCPATLGAGIVEAERIKKRSTKAARVVLGEVVYYSTEERELGIHEQRDFATSVDAPRR